MKRMLFLLMLLVLCAGCSMKYDVTLNKDLSFDVNISSLKLKNDIDTSLDEFRSDYLDRYSNYYDSSDVSSMKIIDNTTDYGVMLKKHYNSMEEFFNSVYVRKLYTDVYSISLDGSVYTIKNDSRLDITELFLYGVEEGPVLNKIDVSIKMPYIVNKHNADSVDKKNNVYTWTYDRYSTYKSFMLEFDSSREFSNGISAKTIIKYVIFVVLFLVICYLFYKNMVKKGNKNNKI